MLALGQARLCTGRGHRRVDHFLMTTGGNHILCYQHFLADRAMLALGQARLCTGRFHRLVNYHLVPLGGDCFLLCSCGLAAVRILERSVAAGADIIRIIAVFRMRRRYGLHFSQIMSQLVNDNILGLDRLGSRFIGKKRPAQPAFPMGLIARFTTGSLL